VVGVVEGLELGPLHLRCFHRGAYAAGEEGLLPGLLPVEALDLARGEADERVAVAEGVVEEGEGVVLGEGGEPEGELGEVDGEGVLVDAVEAELGDLAARV
jgi:hypothetical protein